MVAGLTRRTRVARRDDVAREHRGWCRFRVRRVGLAVDGGVGGGRGRGGSVGCVRRIELVVKGAIGLPDGIDQMEHLAHALAQGDVAAFALGLEAIIEGADRRVVADGGASGVPQIGAHQVVAFGRHAHRAGRHGVALLIDAGRVFVGKDAEITDEMVGGGEAVDVDGLGNEHGGGGHADAGDGDHLLVR